jgi:hypothetical protein
MQGEAELFETASLLTDAKARRAFLDRACPLNPALRDRVERLLELQPEAEIFFAEVGGPPGNSSK